MSSHSDEDDVEVKRRVRSPTAAQRITDLSDDDSDDARLPRARTPSPPRDEYEDEDEIKPQNARSESEDERREPPRILDAHERTVVDIQPQCESVDLLYFPATLEVRTTPPAPDADLPPGDMCPLLFRPARRGGDARIVVRKALQRGALALGDVLESNARLVEWSDGSHTVMVGDEHYHIIADKLVSDHYLFRKGADVQTVEAAVSTVGRVVPHELSGRARSDVAAQVNGKRKVMLTMKEGGEKEEILAKEEAERKDKERARLESKRRASANRNREREEPVDRYEAQDEFIEEEDRFAEEEDRRIKRQRQNDYSFQHKAGGRRKIYGDSDESE